MLELTYWELLEKKKTLEYHQSQDRDDLKSAYAANDHEKISLFRKRMYDRKRGVNGLWALNKDIKYKKRC